jgi:hypothetical protein
LAPALRVKFCLTSQKHSSVLLRQNGSKEEFLATEKNKMSLFNNPRKTPPEHRRNRFNKTRRESYFINFKLNRSASQLGNRPTKKVRRLTSYKFVAALTGCFVKSGPGTCEHNAIIYSRIFWCAPCLANCLFQVFCYVNFRPNRCTYNGRFGTF